MTECPTMISRYSANEWSSSSKIHASGSANIVRASWNDTPCFERLLSAFRGSHSNFRVFPHLYGTTRRRKTRAGSVFLVCQSSIPSGTFRIAEGAAIECWTSQQCFTDIVTGIMHCGVDLRRAEPQGTIGDPLKHGVKRSAGKDSSFASQPQGSHPHGYQTKTA